jgi:hypothetical protein
MIHPRCLDDYASMAYGFAELGGWSDGEDRAPSPPSLESPWFEAGGWRLLTPTESAVAVHRLPSLCADRQPPCPSTRVCLASLLQYKHPRKAKAWFRAMVFMNPGDNMGARYHLLRRSKEAADDLDEFG